jgi:cell division protein FtsZ
MIEFEQDPQQTIPASMVKIVGLGGAGANMLDRVALDGVDGAEIVACNSDVRTLAASVAKEKIQLGRNLTKGLGAGGDPELGRQATMEAEQEIRDALRDRKIVFLCVGLGGGTGSGGAPVVARMAREEGAFVVVFATMPFVFEGKRRRQQADAALNELAVLSNALVTFDNGRMGELVLAKQGVHEAFAAADRMISESIEAVTRLVVRPGLVNVGLDDLMSALRTTRSRCLFGSGQAEGKDRGVSALRNALASPLLDQGALLRGADTVLVHVYGGVDLTLYEIELMMQRLTKHVPDGAHVLFGAAVDPAMGGKLRVTLISSLPEECLLDAAPVVEERRSEAVADDPMEPSEGFVFQAPKKSSQVVAAQPGEGFVFQAPKESVPVVVAQPSEPLDEPEDEPEVAAAFEGFEAGADGEDEDEPEFDPGHEFERMPEALDVEVAGARPSGIPDDTFDELDPEPFEDEPAPAEPADQRPFAETIDADDEPVVAKLGRESMAGNDDDEDPDLTPARIPLRPKRATTQPELAFDSGPTGRFAGGSPNVYDGENLDIPSFLRKKKG